MCMKAPYTSIEFTEENGIAKITLSNPEKMNALTPVMLFELTDALHEAAEDSAVKVIVLTGAGSAFCTGSDVASFQAFDTESAYAHMKQAQQVVTAFQKMTKPIVAVVNGFAAGAGLSLTLLSDIVISSDGVSYGAAFVNVGLLPDLGLLHTLPRAVGTQKAYELMVTGQNVDAQEAHRLGLVNTVVAHDKLEVAVDELTGRLAKQPSRVMALTKTLMHQGLSMGMEELLETEALAQASMIVSADGREGVDAFLNKRPAKFK